jgi:putative ABC transport system permease protein
MLILRMGLRFILNNRLLSVSVVFVLAFSVGVSSFALQVLKATSPVANQQRLGIRPGTYVTIADGGQGGQIRPVTWELASFVRARMPDTQFALCGLPIGTTVETSEGSIGINVAALSSGFFGKFTSALQAGTDFSLGDEQSQDRGIILSHRLASELFGSPGAAIGRFAKLQEITLQVTGVAPAGFSGVFGGPADAWIPPRWITPIYVRPPTNTSAASGSGGAEAWRRVTVFYVLAAMPGMTPDQAAGWMDSHLRALTLAGQGLVARAGITAEPARERALRDWGRLILFLFFGIACAGGLNTAGLLLARGPQQAAAIRMKRALGASSLRLLAELCVGPALQLVLALLFAGSFAVVLERAFGRWFPWSPVIASPSWMSWTERVWPLFAFFAAVSLVCAALPAGLLLRDRGFPQAGYSQTAGVAGSRTMRAIVSAQLAIAICASIFGFLIASGAWKMRRVELGFAVKGRTVFSIGIRKGVRHFETHTDSSGISPMAFAATTIREQLLSMPGTNGVAITQVAPLENIVTSMIARDDTDRGNAVNALCGGVTPSYFRTTAMRFLAGSGFTNETLKGDPAEAVVSRTLAEQLWPSDRAVGRSLALEDPASGLRLSVRVTGVTEASLLFGPEHGPTPILFLPLRGNLWSGVPPVHVIVEGSGSVLDMEAAIDRVLLAQMPALAVRGRYSISDRLESQMEEGRMRLAVVISAGGAVCSVALIGLYGCLAYVVRQRTREMAIRSCCGAGPGSLHTMVLRQAMSMVLAAYGISVLPSFALKSEVDSGLAGAVTWSWSAAALATGFCTAVALCVALIPAGEASRTSPARLLREN